MKVSVTFKLFLAILSACVLAAVAMGIAVRTSFEYGFVDFLQEQGANDLAALEQELEASYAQHGNWDFVRARTRGGPPFDGGPPPGEPPRDARPPDAPGGFHDEGGKDGPFTPGFAEHSRTFRPPYMLYDADMKVVASEGPPPPPEAVRHPLRVRGQTVGWIAVAGPTSLINQAEQRFKDRQTQATWIIVGFTTLLCAAVSIILARTLLTPIKRIVTATHRLAGGDYATRVPATGRDELQMLASDFNRLAASLEKAESDRRDFIADISHELRTPLSVLRGELEAIEDGVRRPDAATIASLQSEVAMLSQLIDDLYELSLADIGQLSFEKVPLDLVPIVEAACDVFRERLAAKRITLEFDRDDARATLSGDPYRLTQLWKNLLENALRYTNEGGRVRISVTSNDNHIYVDVQDSFPPVPAPLLPHLFDRFFRVDPSRSRQSGGAGLGLALCKHIVEQHGGTIEASRSPLGGLRILVQLPRLNTHHD
ncbi:ATP-binding protein [Paraburkholderia sp. J7]|uniref:ATP-binding protein n=1 Tax=Paraburkholderia sp. J7 TaxID=2805438 RepID=UPI002AB5F2B9|nr:ATP-binding protein [Paraburkholderia sp. J7]